MKKLCTALCLFAVVLFATAACNGENGNNGHDTSVDVPADDGGTTTDGYPNAMPAVEGVWTDCPTLPPIGDNVTVRLVLADFEQDFPVENADVEVFLGNIVTETPDVELGPTDTEGRTEEFEAPANSLFAYRVWESADIPFPPGEIKTSIEYGEVIPEGGGDIDAIAVSRHTYQLIPTVLGIPPSPGLGILAGLFEDCSGTEVEGIVVRLYASGSSEPCNNEAAIRCLDRYFVDETPARDQYWSSADGLYGIMEIPPGEGYTLQLHGKIAGSPCPGEMEVLGEMTNIRVLADAISIVDVSAEVAGDHGCVW